MAPFFLDVWMEMASQETAATVKSEKKTLFFIPANDDVSKPAAPQATDKDASQA